MPYKVSPLNKKSVTEVEKWTKDGETLKHSIGWRWGTVIVQEKPDLSEYDPETETIDVYSDWDCELDSCDDGCWEEWEYPDSWTEEDIEKFQEAWEEEWHEAPTSMGWQEDDTELWFSGPLEITEIE
jgi:hypothetical protein